MTPTVDLMHFCQTGAMGLVYYSPTSDVAPATWFAWGQRPHTIRMVPHGYMPARDRAAYDRAIRDVLDRIGAAVVEATE